MPGELGLHANSIKFPISLRPRALNRRAFAPVQQAKLDPGFVGHTTHHAIHCVNFAYQMAFAEPANRWIARHHADAFAF